MSIARSSLAGGPATALYRAANIHFGDDAKADFEVEVEDSQTQFFGSKADGFRGDRRVKISGRPLEYASQSILFPYLSTPVGEFVCKTLGVDKPLVLNCLNTDIVTVTAALVTKMPSLFLGLDKPLIGDMEFTGIVGDSMDPETASSYFAMSTGAYVPVALTAANIIRQRYVGAWGAIAGFTALNAKEGWNIDWELMLEPVKVHGITRDYRFLGLRAMAKCIPIGPTQAQINTNLLMQGAGATEGSRISAVVGDMVITGAGVSVTIKNAAMKSAGFVFGGKPLRIGEVGWVSTQVVSSGTATAVAVIA